MKAGKLKYVILFSVLVFGLLAGVQTVLAEQNNWQETLKKAKGQTVDWYMYGGLPATNTYVNSYLAPLLKKEYGITLRQVPTNDIAAVISKLLVEKQAGKTKGKVDLLWINGENFRTAKKHQLLFGPYAQRLPNIKYVSTENPSVSNDFGTPVDDMESPWGGAQVVFAYDSARVLTPPATMEALIKWIEANPGQFTYPAPPDFTGSAFVRHVFYHFSKSPDQWAGKWNEGEFQETANKTYALLNELKPYLWRKGSTYPESPVRLNQLLADGEVTFSLSYNPAEASKMIHDGRFPDTIRTFVFKEGTIANTHFAAIPFNASDKEAAMVVANLLLSPEAQWRKADPRIWGDLPAINVNKLPENWQKKFATLPRGKATLPPSILAEHQLPELPSALLVKLEKGWQKQVLKK